MSQWVDVTAECRMDINADEEPLLIHGQYKSLGFISAQGYRLCKVQFHVVERANVDAIQRWAFIVERREP